MKKNDCIKSKNIELILFAVMTIIISVLDPHKLFRSHMAFYVVLLILTITLVFIKKRNNLMYIRNSIICIVSITTIFLALIGARHHFASDIIFYNIIHDKPTTLIERASDAGDSGVLDSTFTIYYFKNKNIYCSDEETVQKIKENLTDVYYSESFYNYEIYKENDLTISNSEVEFGLSYPRYTDNNGNIYIVEKGIKSDRLVCIDCGNYLLYCSKDLYESYMNSDSKNYSYLETTNEDAIIKLSQLTTNNSTSNNISKTMSTQFIAIILFLVIGLVICISLWSELGGWLVTMLTIPIGVIAWVSLGTLLVIMRLPYNIYVQMGVFIVGLGVMVYKNRLKFKQCNYLEYFIPMVVLLLALMYYTTTCHTTTSYDSIKKLQLGYMLAIDNKPHLLFTNVAIYGLIEPFIHSLGYMLGGDYLYAIYPMFFVVNLGLIGGGLFRIYNIKDSFIGKNQYSINKFIFLMVALAIGLLITNSDYRYAKYYAMSHIIISTFFLIFCLFVLWIKNDCVLFTEWGLFFSTIAIIITRTEGIIYILFFLTLLIGYINDVRLYKSSNVICLMCVIWTIIQLLLFNGNDGDGYFFSPKKAAVLIVGSIMTMVYLLLIFKNKFQFLVKRNYVIKYLGIMLFIIVIVSTRVWDMAVTNYGVYIGHLSSFIERNMNSGFLWGFVIVAIPFLLLADSDNSKITVGIVLGYLALVFFIFLFRNELPMHEGFGDSGRRMIVHIMPTSIYLILSTMIYESLEIIKREET